MINLQGDLPAIDPEALRTVAATLRESDADIATLAAPITNPADYDNPNVVKPIVVWGRGGKSGRALYFTRAKAPSGAGTFYHHIGIYAFTRPAPRVSSRSRLRRLRSGRSLSSCARLKQGCISKSLS